MSEDRLKTYVLRKADSDETLSEPARLTVLAALGDPGDLLEVLGDRTTSQQLIDLLNTDPSEAAVPVGAYLRSISVQGFRGIGPETTVPIAPGPGLVVIAGRNGSGKSTLAEALELALTGTNSRWADKAAVWSGSWRNLHHGEPAEIRIGLTEDGVGTTTLGVDWPSGPEVEFSQLKRWVQRAGAKRESTEVLGWDGALEMYRPLLSYDELGGILEGKPSEFYDQLYKLLGLEKLTEAIDRLAVEVKHLGEPAAAWKRLRDRLKPLLENHADPRAAAALAQVKKTKPDLDKVRPLITDGTESQLPPAWLVARELSFDPAELEKCCARVQNALHHESEVTSRANAQAADRTRLLELGLQYHQQHGSGPCPLCEQGALNDEWAAAARLALDTERTTAQELMTARSAAAEARQTLTTLASNVPAPPDADDELTALPAALAAYQEFMAVAEGVELADHVAVNAASLHEAYEALRQEADELSRQLEDAWNPVALELAGWLQQGDHVAAAAETLGVASEAHKWLQDNANDLRNQRIAPLADHARDIWSKLRQESNVALGKIRLEGKKTSRKVVLEAHVDGSGTEAFGVMSQGELQALALAIFIPRATSAASPFRFIVFDDPIQAMDPSKIDGFLSVLTELARDRQVVVLTHDDRLPSAIRRMRTPARVVEVTRGTNSAVSVLESSQPVKRLLDDAFAIAADDGVPDAIKKAAVPVLCREALEAAAWDVYNSRAMANGLSRESVESTWEEAGTVRKRLALAILLDAKGDPTKWLSGGSARGAAMAVATKGAHAGVADFKLAVNQVRTAVKDLAREGV